MDVLPIEPPRANLFDRFERRILSMVCLLAASTQFYDWSVDAKDGPRAMTDDEWAAKVIARRDALLRAERPRG